MSIAEHEETVTTKDVVITPEHAQRGAESAEFSRNVERLKADGHYSCFICKTEENLQVHHYGREWSLAEGCDFDELKAFLLQNDVYGYSNLLRNLPITSVDDIRNLMVLCQPHHTGVDHADGGTGTGIHNTVHPIWLAQRTSLKGLDPVPQEGQTLADVEAAIAAVP